MPLLHEKDLKSIRLSKNHELASLKQHGFITINVWIFLTSFS